MRLIEIAIQSTLGEPGALEYILEVNWPPTPKDILEPSHGRVFREKFCSVYVVKGVWSLLKDLFFNRVTHWDSRGWNAGSEKILRIPVYFLSAFIRKILLPIFWSYTPVHSTPVSVHQFIGFHLTKQTFRYHKVSLLNKPNTNSFR